MWITFTQLRILYIKFGTLPPFSPDSVNLSNLKATKYLFLCSMPHEQKMAPFNHSQLSLKTHTRAQFWVTFNDFILIFTSTCTNDAWFSFFKFNILNENKTLIGVSKFNKFYHFLKPIRDDGKGKLEKVNKQTIALNLGSTSFLHWRRWVYGELHTLPLN